MTDSSGPRALRRTNAARVALGPVLAMIVGCGTTSHEADTTVEYGVGAKADGAHGCDATADLCWGVDDSTAMRSVLREQDALAFGAPDPATRAVRMLDGVLALSHKLDEAERDALVDLYAWAERLTDVDDVEAVREFCEAVASAGLERLLAGYTAAYLVPVGARAAGDDVSFREADAGGPWSPGMLDSLRQLEDTGPFGQIYAFMLEHTGVIDDPYLPFDEIFPFSEPREDRARRIVTRAQAWAGVSAAAAGAESLIPIAGVVVSFSHGVFFNFRIRARMGLELAALYGLDIRQDDHLFQVMAALMAQESLGSIRNEVFGWAAARWLADTALRKGLGLDSTAIVRALVRDLVHRMTAAMTHEGAELAARAAAQQAATGAGKQILGYATFGLFVLGDIAVNVHVTGEIGHGLETAFKPWGVGLMEESARFLATDAGRACAATMLGEMSFADGSLDPDERAFLVAHLGRIFWDDDARGWMQLTVEGARGHAERIAEVGRRGWADWAALDACARQQWGNASRQERLTVAATAGTLMRVDDDVSDEEWATYTTLVEALDVGDAVEGVDAFLHALLIDRTAFESTAEAVETLPAADVLPYLSGGRPEFDAVFACAVDSICEG